MLAAVPPALRTVFGTRTALAYLLSTLLNENEMRSHSELNDMIRAESEEK